MAADSVAGLIGGMAKWLVRMAIWIRGVGGR